MKLLANDSLGIYVWVDDADHTVHISPHFDYIEDAEDWYKRNIESKNDQHKDDAN